MMMIIWTQGLYWQPYRLNCIRNYCTIFKSCYTYYVVYSSSPWQSCSNPLWWTSDLIGQGAVMVTVICSKGPPHSEKCFPWPHAIPRELPLCSIKGDTCGLTFVEITLQGNGIVIIILYRSVISGEHYCELLWADVWGINCYLRLILSSERRKCHIIQVMWQTSQRQDILKKLKQCSWCFSPYKIR